MIFFQNHNLGAHLFLSIRKLSLNSWGTAQGYPYTALPFTSCKYTICKNSAVAATEIIENKLHKSGLCL
jgi:hypothetical protein